MTTRMSFDSVDGTNQKGAARTYTQDTTRLPFFIIALISSLLVCDCAIQIGASPSSSSSSLSD